MTPNLHLWMRYTLSTDELLYATDLKPEAIVEMLTTFLQDLIGTGEDKTPPAEADVYNIRIRMDLSGDVFYTQHDCGNLKLRDGILLAALQKFEEKIAREVPAKELVPMADRINAAKKRQGAPELSCCNCGKKIDPNAPCVSGGLLTEGEGACSSACYDKHHERFEFDLAITALIEATKEGHISWYPCQDGGYEVVIVKNNRRERIVIDGPRFRWDILWHGAQTDWITLFDAPDVPSDLELRAELRKAVVEYTRERFKKDFVKTVGDLVQSVRARLVQSVQARDAADASNFEEAAESALRAALDVHLRPWWDALRTHANSLVEVQRVVDQLRQEIGQVADEKKGVTWTSATG